MMAAGGTMGNSRNPPPPPDLGSVRSATGKRRFLGLNEEVAGVEKRQHPALANWTLAGFGISVLASVLAPAPAIGARKHRITAPV